MSSRAGSPPGRRRVPRRARREVRQVRAERLVLERRVVVRQPRRVDLERRARAVVDGRPRRAVAVVARDRDDLDDAPQRLGLVGGVQPGPAPGRRLLSLRRRARLGGQLGSHLFFVRVGCFFSAGARRSSPLVREQQTSGLSRPAPWPPRTLANERNDETGTTWRAQKLELTWFKTRTERQPRSDYVHFCPVGVVSRDLPRRPPPKPESPIVILETQDSQAYASRVAAREVEGPGPAWGVPSLSLSSVPMPVTVSL